MLWRQEGLEAIETRGLYCGTLHGCEADEGPGNSRSSPSVNWHRYGSIPLAA